MKYSLEFTQTALKDIEKHKKSGNKVILKKLELLLNELLIHSETETGKPEILRFNYQGLYSRRINQKHRLIYKIKNDKVIVLILSAYGHYSDK